MALSVALARAGNRTAVDGASQVIRLLRQSIAFGLIAATGWSSAFGREPAGAAVKSLQIQRRSGPAAT